MRSLRLNEREDPQPTLDKLRELGDEHRVYYNDFTDKDLVETFLVVLEKSTAVSPYEAPLYQHVIEDLNTAAVTPAFDTVALRVRHIWQREGVSRLARFPPPTPPDSGGDGWTRRPASGGARAMALRAASVQEAVGEWRTKGGPYRVDDASADDDELFKPTLAMIAGEESDDEEWPAFATGLVWVPPTARG
ncbi:hypothetical protein CYMTET_3970 [Cymbomonas tetramitiformis]|uniref:Uncharacterized protein n=1 Tax=Cymbomonas tetramitiformis TaxID=36881 RepID=A0AAE0LKY6_9CHLO|nr:hypothetical protein CYMTET_3970 [Cymbomonas tetramitiformis]